MGKNVESFQCFPLYYLEPEALNWLTIITAKATVGRSALPRSLDGTVEISAVQFAANSIADNLKRKSVQPATIKPGASKWFK